MVQCCNPDCANGWYHLPCIQLARVPEGDWYCSRRCREAPGWVYCSCRKKQAGPVVRCSLGSECRRHEYYHTACLQEQDFTGKIMLWCVNWPWCFLNVWSDSDWQFNQRLSTQIDSFIFDMDWFITDWYCSEECLQGEGTDDGILEYSKELMYQGLLLLANRDCVREGDGEALIKLWKFHLPSFWENNHYKYVILAHQLIASKYMFY